MELQVPYEQWLAMERACVEGRTAYGYEYEPQTEEEKRAQRISDLRMVMGASAGLPRSVYARMGRMTAAREQEVMRPVMETQCVKCQRQALRQRERSVLRGAGYKVAEIRVLMFQWEYLTNSSAGDGVTIGLSNSGLPQMASFRRSECQRALAGTDPVECSCSDEESLDTSLAAIQNLIHPRYRLHLPNAGAGLTLVQVLKLPVKFVTWQHASKLYVVDAGEIRVGYEGLMRLDEYLYELSAAEEFLTCVDPDCVTEEEFAAGYCYRLLFKPERRPAACADCGYRPSLSKVWSFPPDWYDFESYYQLYVDEEDGLAHISRNGKRTLSDWLLHVFSEELTTESGLPLEVMKVGGRGRKLHRSVPPVSPLSPVVSETTASGSSVVEAFKDSTSLFKYGKKRKDKPERQRRDSFVYDPFEVFFKGSDKVYPWNFDAQVVKGPLDQYVELGSPAVRFDATGSWFVSVPSGIGVLYHDVLYGHEYNELHIYFNEPVTVRFVALDGGSVLGSRVFVNASTCEVTRNALERLLKLDSTKARFAAASSDAVILRWPKSCVVAAAKTYMALSASTLLTDPLENGVAMSETRLAGHVQGLGTIGVVDGGEYGTFTAFRNDASTFFDLNGCALVASPAAALCVVGEVALTLTGCAALASMYGEGLTTKGSLSMIRWSMRHIELEDSYYMDETYDLDCQGFQDAL